jgi:hypothetical protein
MYRGGLKKWMPQKRGLMRLGQRLGQLGDRQARGVGRDDRMRRDVRRDLLVQVQLPVHALGDRLDHQVAFAQQAMCSS